MLFTFSAAIYAYTLSHLGDMHAAVSMQITAWLINHEMILGLTDSNEGIPPHTHLQIKINDCCLISTS